MRYLKQSTASTIVMGPFVDSTDGVTAKTALSIAQADIRVSKNGGAFAQTNNATGATHMENGYYSVPLDSTDSNTVGRITVAVVKSGALPVRYDAMVMSAVPYDSLIAATDNFDVSVTQWTGTNVATVDTAGYPKVTIKSGTGTGEVNLTSGVADANVTKWSGTAVAAVDTAGYPKVTVKSGTGTGEISLSAGVAQADVAKWAATTVATPDTVGYPKVTIKSGVGTGEISLSAGVANADMVKISTDSVAADNAESFFDGTGYAGTNNVIPTVTTTGTATNVTTVNGIAAGAITAAAIATNAIDADALATDFVTELTTAILASGDVDGYTLEQTLKLVLAMAAGKVTANPTSVVFRAADDSKDRITATVASDGDRTAITLDATG